MFIFIKINILMKRKFLYNVLNFYILGALTFSIGCKRTEIPITPDPPPINPPITVVNDLLQVIASVSGIVLDESNAPIANAEVTSGAAITTTNTNGMFIFQNISLSKENGNVTVTKAGYFKGVRSFKTTEGKNHSVRIQLMQRISSGTVNAAAGGTITSNGGATIVFPANAFVTSTGAAYTGAVTVYSRWIDPTAANLPFVIPGDLRGVSTTGVESILTTYGMVGAELTDANGNILKIATGKTATISFPIPVSLSATAPTSIVLWHFDDATARWKENGTATKTGSTYNAQVDKFSFWNCDVANANFINLDYTLINATTNTPLVSTSTRIKRVTNGSYGYGVTNNVGFVSGLVPKNEALVLEVFVNTACNTVVFTQNIGPFSANTSLGNINITIPSSQYISFTGTLVNCSAAPVSNGYVSFYGAGGNNAFVSTSATGSFSFTVLNCSGTSMAYEYQGTDYTTNQQSAIFSSFTTGTIINMGAINACGSPTGANVYAAGSVVNTSGNYVATLWKNGVATNLTDGTKNARAASVFVSGTDVYVAGYETGENAYNFTVAKIWKNGMAINLTNGTISAEANSVFVSGTDVYVAGREAVGNGSVWLAKVWKNGVATALSNDYQGRASANSVAVAGTDVYVAGTVQEYGSGFIQFNVPKIWKNGINIQNTSEYGISNSIFVSGTDVYTTINRYYLGITGSRKSDLWKNNILTNIFAEDLSIYARKYASSVFVSSNDVYVALSETAGSNTSPQISKAKVWKNGIVTDLTNGTYDASANSIFVLGTDVYVGGSEYTATGGLAVKIWKNGIATNLTNGTNYAIVNSIFVK
jgi:hypothetical protein